MKEKIFYIIISNLNIFLQVEWSGRVAALDPLYDVLWSVCGDTGTVQCHNPTTNDIELEGKQNIMTADLALPVSPGCLVSRSQAALNLLSCLDTITSVSPLNSLSHSDEDSARLGSSKAYSKEDFSIVNRFDSHGGGWGYSGHSIEAVRFTVDTDILMGGFGLFGGRGEYVGKIKLFDIGADGGENEGDGDLLCKSEVSLKLDKSIRSCLRNHHIFGMSVDCSSGSSE